MQNANRYLLFFELTDIDILRAIFGEVVTELLWEDIYADATQIFTQLLQRHHIESPIYSPAQGRCFVSFTYSQHSVMVDVQEQSQVILDSGRLLLDKSLATQIGAQNSRNLHFRFTIIPFNGDLSQGYIDNLIAHALSMDEPVIKHTDRDLSPYANIRTKEFESILDNKDITIYFQPIVSLPSNAIVGYEALSRGPADSPVHRADELFNSAAYFGLTESLELLCVERALEWIKHIPEQRYIALNIGAQLLSSGAFHAFITQQHLAPILPRLIFEITEHLPLESVIELKKHIYKYNQLGLRISLDDTGCGFFDLTTVEHLSPQVVKLCINVIRRIDNAGLVAEEINKTRQTIETLKAQTLGEGVETEYQRQVLIDCGVTLAQGYLFAKPKAASEMFPQA